MTKKTKINIDHSKCGVNVSTDPRDCRKCLFVCDPAVFLMHPTLEKHPDPHNPDKWVVDAIWLSKCTGCMKCINACPEQAIEVFPGDSLAVMRGI
ncbi:MAG: 4Fe-4S dicluster domain-containing protein [Candidatus Thorarchaeota archaeon]